MLSPSGNPADLTPSSVTQSALDLKLDVLCAALANPPVSAALDPFTFNPITATITVGSGIGSDKNTETVKVTQVVGA